MPKINQKNNAPLVVVGMSGGVDSSVTAYLLKQQGYDVVGVHMLHLDKPENVQDVIKVCDKIGIKYHFVERKNEFMTHVVNRYTEEIGRGITPNPCCYCNRDVKFKMLCDVADEIGAQFIATGHYIKLKDGKLMRAVDQSKDQTYFLCAVTKDQLSRAIFPLGDYHKTEVREIARKIGLVVHDKKDSTDICFDFPKGNMTIGQRVNQGGQKSRMYVVSKCPKTGEMQIGADDDPRLYSKGLVAKDFNWLVNRKSVFNCTAKTRYRQPDQECMVEILNLKRGEPSVQVIFKSPQRAVTPGQWVVLYDGDVVLGGGEIFEVIP